MCYLHRAGHGLGALSDTHGMHTGFQHGEELLVRKRKAGQDAEAGAGETLCDGGESRSPQEIHPALGVARKTWSSCKT